MSSALSDPPRVRWLAAFAHTDEQGDPAETVVTHLERVAAAVERALRGAAPELRRLALTSALIHDAGKSTPWFQAYLLGKAPKSLHTRHSRTGALVGWYLARSWPPRERAALLQNVLRHHGRPDAPPEKEIERLRGELTDPAGSEGAVAREQLEALDLEGLTDWLSARSPALGLDLKDMRPEKVLSAAAPSSLGWYRLVESLGERELPDFLRHWTAYGALLAADRTDVATAGAERSRPHLPPRPVEAYIERELGGAEVRASPLSALRREVSDAVRAELLSHPDHGLYTLTAPTGSGKTLAVLRAALGLREALTERGEPAPRIVYCLPFTSVIDQNHGVFADVLKGGDGGAPPSDVLLKHHHLTELEYRSHEGREWEPDGAGRLLVETWQSEVVVSTFHQLLHTFLSGRSRDSVRAPAWVGSIVILDEVQAIPLKYWAPVGRLLAAASRELGARFILMTATRPLIFEPGTARELLPDHRRYFEALDRVDLRLRFDRDLSLDEIADLVIEARSRGGALLILNTRAAVREAYRLLSSRLGQESVVPLSTSLTPFDRKRRIDEISERIGNGEDLVVVSTQLVEAGVDLSFPTVVRDLAPLDCVIQSAGRCNRHGGPARGRVELISMAPLPGRKRRPASQVYDPVLLGATRDTFAYVAKDEAVLAESRFLELSEVYFTACRERSESQDVDLLAARGDFEGLQKSFRLIEERAHRLWFVPRTREAEELWDLWERCRFEAPDEPLDEAARAARAEMRRRRSRFMEYVVHESAPEPDDRVRRLPQTRYDPALGLTPED